MRWGLRCIAGVLVLLAGCGPGPNDGPHWPPLAPGEHGLLFTGDLLLSEHIEKKLSRHGDGWALEHLAPVLKAAEAVAVIGNHEGPLTRRTEATDGFLPNTRWNYGARPETAKALADAGFTHLSLANNHALDRGLAGLQDSRRAIQDAGMIPFGAAATEQQARAPLHVQVGGLDVAILGFMHPWKAYRHWDPKKGEGGVALLGAEAIEASVTRARDEGADRVILYPHWGPGYKPVDNTQKAEADAAIASGVHAIVGHHSHAAQGFGHRNGVPVLWSLGNAMFGTGGRFGDEHGHGLLARLVIAQGAPVRFEIKPIRVNNQRNGWRTKLAPRAEAEEVLRSLAARHGAHIEIVDGVGVLAWP